jgi:cobalt-zinc-cadmium efflux system membrane fusion protein
VTAVAGRAPTLLAIGLMLSVLGACGGRDEAASTATPLASATAPSAGTERIARADDDPVQTMIRTQVVHRVALPLSEILPARVVYDEDHTARVTAGFAGRIARLIAAPGAAVRVGSPLAEIDSPDFGQAASDLAKARADEQHKRLTLARSRDLLTGGVIPQKDVEAADADFEQAVAETRRAAQRLQNLNPSGSTINGGHFLLTSPIVGTVTERNANPAMEVNPSLPQPLFVISDLKRLWILIDVPERLLGQIRNGMKVSIETDAFPGRSFAATIVYIAQVLDPATRRIAVRAAVDNATLELRPEMFVRATVLRDQGVGVRVPNEALVTAGLYTYVFQRAPDHTFRRVRVEPIVKGPEYSYIDNGLEDGDEIVTSGAVLLAADQQAKAGAQ